jgi:hypothetical protein
MPHSQGLGRRCASVACQAMLQMRSQAGLWQASNGCQHVFMSQRHTAADVDLVEGGATQTVEVCALNSASSPTGGSGAEGLHAVASSLLGDAAPSVTEYRFHSIGLAAYEALHVSTGLPWFATLPLATVIVRSMLMPLSLRQVRDMPRPLHAVQCSCVTCIGLLCFRHLASFSFPTSGSPHTVQLVSHVRCT